MLNFDQQMNRAQKQYDRELPTTNYRGRHVKRTKYRDDNARESAAEARAERMAELKYERTR